MRHWIGQCIMAGSLSSMTLDNQTWIVILQCVGWIIGALLAYLQGKRDGKSIA